jgi:DNA-directed RNA polymerase subunit N
MIIPVRCFTCGYPISKHWLEFKERTEKGENTKKILDSMGIERYCCRTLLMTHKDVLADIAKFKV